MSYCLWYLLSQRNIFLYSCINLLLRLSSEKRVNREKVEKEKLLHKHDYWHCTVM